MVECCRGSISLPVSVRGACPCCRYDPFFRPGEHYASFRYDLKDFQQQVESLLAEDASGSTRLTDMAARAAHEALQRFHIFGQLDALAYAIMQVSSE